MPIGKIQRKPSNETLASLGMDSTLDSRMSSTDIPQMELLKVNYVHQRKEALMQKPESSSPSSSQQQQQQRPTSSSNYKFAAFKKIPLTANTSHHTHALNVTKVAIGGGASSDALKPTTNHQHPRQAPLPPVPTVQSWQFLQNAKRAAPKTPPTKQQHQQQPKFVVQPTPLEDSDNSSSCCCNSGNSSSASDSDSTMSPGCEKSNSWDYRSKVSTRDIRRDIARAGIKSRTDRIARIERSDDGDQRREQRPSNGGSAVQRSTSNQQPQSSTSNSDGVVSKINQMFETAAKQQQQRIQERLKSPPPQPKRQAPVPKKEPNMRHRLFSPIPPATQPVTSPPPLPPHPPLASDERIKRMNTNAADCCDCLCASSGNDTSSTPPEVSKRTSSLGNRYRAQPVTINDTKHISRIPKPINDHLHQSNSSSNINNRNSTTSAILYSEANEQLQRRIKQMFEHEGAATTTANGNTNIKLTHYADVPRPKLKKTKSVDLLETSRTSTKNAELRSKYVDAEDARMRRSDTRPAQSAVAYQKVKIERVHIRKKRQPLLIINQLTTHDTQADEQRPNETHEKLHNDAAVKVVVDNGGVNDGNDERRTCGYKNCNFANCPMSAQHQMFDADTNKFKRHSLESSSDSGVSSYNDAKEQLKENNMKNLADCTDCVKILRSSQAIKPEHVSQHAYNKMKLSPQLMRKTAAADKPGGGAVGATQIKIHVGKSTAHADPNDVQNFAKKNLTKATTDELLTAALNNSTPKSAKAAKQCNIENDLKNNEQRKYNNLHNQRTTIRIDDDDWVPEPSELLIDDFLDTDSLMLPPPAPPATKSERKPINAGGDNCVKIFVRSSETFASAAVGVAANSKRASSVSANSYASQTSGCSSSTSSACSTSSTSNSSALSYAASSSSGCCGSNADNQSLCESEQDCCCQLAMPNANTGMFFNQRGLPVSITSDSCRACAASPVSSTGAISEVSCVTCAPPASPLGGHKQPISTIARPLSCDAVGGVYWNNSYFHNDADAAADEDNNCCCSLSSCDEDNCSYYEGNLGGIVVVESTAPPSPLPLPTPALPAPPLPVVVARSAAHIDRVDTDRFAVLQQRRQRQLLRNSSAEEILIRNKKLLRKTDVIHELRPRSMDGVIDSGVSLNGDIGSSPDSGEHLQNQQDSEARRLNRGHVLSELLETERIYVNEMSSILKGYCDQMQSEEMMHLVPASLQGKEDLLFGNLHELYTFHNEIFLKDLENCISTTELVALCFVQRRDTFYRLYSFYCQNIPRSDRLRETLVDTHLFLQECQKRLGHKLPLAAYLLKPVQRITKYQLLLKDLLRFSDSGSCTKELQKALDCMLIVLKCVNDSMHQVAITGFPSDLSQQGELLLQDSFQVWTESKKDIRLRIKPQQRHIFLYQKSMLFCKQTSKPGHNKSTYQFKHYLKMSQIGLTESVRGDTKRFEVWLQGRQEVHTIQAPTIEIKNKWVAEIKRVLLNQLEELKGEKIKQYGLNHRGLRQTTSWDTPNIIIGTPQRTISCDASSDASSSNRHSNCSSSGDDNCLASTIGGVGQPGCSNISLGGATGATIPAAGACAGDKEQQEACGWSSDYSNSEDEMSIIEDNSTPGSKFVALADYVAMGHSEVSMREGDTVELLKVGCAGWWFVRVLEANAEGWTPAAYLESLNRKSSRSSSRNQERMHMNKLPE